LTTLTSAIPEISFVATKLKMGHVTVTTPILRVICHSYAVTDIAYLCTKFDHCCFSCSRDMVDAHES